MPFVLCWQPMQPCASLKAFLNGIALFGGLGDDTLARLTGMMVEESLPRGAEVCRQGTRGRCMYVVGEGEVVVVRDGPSGSRVRVVRLGPGEFFGEMTLIDPQPRSATVLVEQPARLYSLQGKDLYQLYQDDVHGYVLLLQNLNRELCRRLRYADERLEEWAVASRDLGTQIRKRPRLKP